MAPTEKTPLLGVTGATATYQKPLKPSDSDLSMEDKARLFDEHDAAAMRLSQSLLGLSALEKEGAEGLDDGIGGNAGAGGKKKKVQLTERDILKECLDVDVGGDNDDDGDSDDSKTRKRRGRGEGLKKRKSLFDKPTRNEKETMAKMGCMAVLAVVVVVAVVVVIGLGEVTTIGMPKSQPVGDYKLVQLQEGAAFFDFYNVYEGRDSAGSNGYNLYVGLDYAMKNGIVQILQEKRNTTSSRSGASNDTTPPDIPDISANTTSSSTSSSQSLLRAPNDNTTSDTAISDAQINGTNTTDNDEQTQQQQTQQQQTQQSEEQTEEFVYMGSKSTPEGPRDSIRLEGKHRFSRGLFILDVRHMPAGCGTWPAFWLTDENNWPVNGEIDILEGVNYQTQAKTALHASRECVMDDVPNGVMTGGWDTAVGVPDKDTGEPDMTMRYAKNCYVYDPHQWLNQGCVAVDNEEGRIGQPLNENGGGVYALEWDPINRRIRSWVFTPHGEVPENLSEAIRTADKTEEERVLPDPAEWGLPYGYFAIGDNTDCPSNHFKNMRIVINLAFCGSVAGNRYFMDCPAQFKQHKTCNEYIKSQPKEIEEEAYWKIKGVYVYQREWVRAWVGK